MSLSTFLILWALGIVVVLVWWIYRADQYGRHLPLREDSEPPKLPEEFKSLAEGKCPNCGCDDFLMGPSSGISHNIKCSGCGSRFNITLWGNTVLRAERI